VTKCDKGGEGVNFTQLEMWANAQRDGRPAKYKWGRKECRAATLPRCKPAEISKGVLDYRTDLSR